MRRKSLLWCGDGVSDYTGNIFNTRVAGDDECWGALGVSLGEALEEYPK